LPEDEGLLDLPEDEGPELGLEVLPDEGPELGPELGLEVLPELGPDVGELVRPVLGGPEVVPPLVLVVAMPALVGEVPAMGYDAMVAMPQLLLRLRLIQM